LGLSSDTGFGASAFGFGLGVGSALGVSGLGCDLGGGASDFGCFFCFNVSLPFAKLRRHCSNISGVIFFFFFDGFFCASSFDSLISRLIESTSD
jgi:hypothetical protein